MNGIDPEPVRIALRLTDREQVVLVVGTVVGLLAGILLAHPAVPLWVAPLLVGVEVAAAIFAWWRLTLADQEPDDTTLADGGTDP